MEASVSDKPSGSEFGEIWETIFGVDDRYIEFFVAKDVGQLNHGIYMYF